MGKGQVVLTAQQKNTLLYPYIYPTTCIVSEYIPIHESPLSDIVYFVSTCRPY